MKFKKIETTDKNKITLIDNPKKETLHYLMRMFNPLRTAQKYNYVVKQWCIA